MFGLYLKKLREKNRLTQDELAEKLGVTRQAISKWENDRTYPDIENIKCLSELYGVTVENIVYAENKEKAEVVQKKSDENHILLREKTSVFESQLIIWIMISLAAISCFIPPLGIILSIAFLLLGRRVKYKYLKILLYVVCTITLMINIYSCTQIMQILYEKLCL